MEFENQYLTYAEYISLGGEQIGETPFNLLEFEARKQIDLRTQRRLIDIETIPDEVKLCMMNLINKIYDYSKSLNNTSSNGSIASESIDGYSISYVNASQIKDIILSKNNEIDDIIINYLFGVIVNNEHLIYIGVK